MNISIHDLLQYMEDDTLVGIKVHDCTTIYPAGELRDVQKNEYTWWLFKSITSLSCVSDEEIEPDCCYLEFTVE